MIFPWEDEFLFELIREQNEKSGREPLSLQPDEHLTWDPNTKEIVVLPGRFLEYDPPDLQHMTQPEDPVIQVCRASGSESHLQAYLTQNYVFLAVS